jgi:hypothetical protein
MARAKRRRAAAAPLDSPNWWPFGRALEYCRSQPLFRDVDLIAAVEQGDVHVKLEQLDESTKPAKRISRVLTKEFFEHEAVIIRFWNTFEIKSRTPGRTLRRPYTLCFWQPDLDRLWPPEATPTTSEPQPAKAQPRVASAPSAPVKRWRKPPTQKDIKNALLDPDEGILKTAPTLSGEELENALCKRLGEGMTRAKARAAIRRWAPQTVKPRGRPRKEKSPK